MQPLFKLPNCPLKQQPHILQLSAALCLAFSLFEEQQQALLAYCHFCSFWNFQKTLYTLHTETMLKTGYSIQHKIWSHWVYQIYKVGGVVNRFLTAWQHFWIPWSEQTHCMENGQSTAHRGSLLHYTGPTLRKNPTVLQSGGIINLFPSIFLTKGYVLIPSTKYLFLLIKFAYSWSLFTSVTLACTAWLDDIYSSRQQFVRWKTSCSRSFLN